MNTFHTLFLSSKEVFGIEVFDNDFYKLLVLFGLNFLSTLLLARFIYYPFNNKKREFIFAYMVVSSVIFFLCFALKAFKFNTGVAIGLFALLGVIRFRTDTISLKEMAYLFVFIGVSMINAFSKKMSLYEIGFINLAFISLTAIGEKLLQQKESSKRTANFELTYGNLKNLSTENYEALKNDIGSTTGLKVESVKIMSMDLKTNEAKLKVYYEK